MNRTFTLCFSLYPIALPFGYVLIYTFYHYAVPDANSNLNGKIQFGESTVTCKASSIGSTIITFKKSYTDLPIIVASTGEDVTSPSNWMVSNHSITKREKTGFVINVKNDETKERTIFVYWVAIGK